MQRVLRSIFFIDDKIESNMKFWALLGPFLLFFTLSLASFEMALIAAGCLFLCYRFRFKGLGLSIIAIVAYSLYFVSALEENHLWNFGLHLSILLGLIISTYGFDEVNSSLSSHIIDSSEELEDLKNQLVSKQKAFDENKKLLEKHLSFLKEEVEKKQDRIAALIEDSENHKKLLEENQTRKDYLLNELDQKVLEIEKLTAKQDELYEKISFMKDEEFLVEKNKNLQSEIENLNAVKSSLVQKMEDLEKANEKVLMEKTSIEKDLLVKVQEIEDLKSEKQKLSSEPKVDLSQIEELKIKINEKEQNIEKLKEKLKNRKEISLEYITDEQLLRQFQENQNELKHVSSLYYQLKDQFEDKQSILHKTRQELFQTKERLTAMLRKESEDCCDIGENEKMLINDFDFMQGELGMYKKENEDLQELVSLLLKPVDES